MLKIYQFQTSWNQSRLLIDKQQRKIIFIISFFFFLLNIFNMHFYVSEVDVDHIMTEQ